MGISCVDIPQAVETIRGWVEAGQQKYVCVTGMHGVMDSRSDAELRSIHNRSGLTTPDGMPMVWAAKWAGAKWVRRVYGPDLLWAVCRQAVEQSWTSYFVGGAPGVAAKLVDVLHDALPELQVVGVESPPFRPLDASEMTDLAARINAASPDLIWVGLGTPKQERWMSEYRALLDAPVLLGVGAAFDLVAGTLKQAPLWMQHHGLEWLYRLAVEPARLWRRYLLNIPRFCAALVRQPPRLVGINEP